MGADSKIEWTHHTFNPWRGCTKVSDGCKHCYAERMSGRNPKVLGVWGPNGARAIAAESYWKQPFKWAAEAKAAGERQRVFCASLADVGEGRDTMPEASWDAVQGARIRLSRTIVATADWLDWLLLTKRPENMPELYSSEVLSRCWLGTSVEDQQRADERIPHLLRCPAAVRFLSCEPLLGEIDLGRSVAIARHREFDVMMGKDSRLLIDWVIVGGESGGGSGGGSRPCVIGHVRSLVRQCKAAGVACFVKQLGAKPVNREGVAHPLKDPKGGTMEDWPEDLRVRQFPVVPEHVA